MLLTALYFYTINSLVSEEVLELHILSWCFICSRLNLNNVAGDGNIQSKGETISPYGSYHMASLPDFSMTALIPQIVNMHFQSVGLCLGLLFITVNAEFMNDGVDVEDFSENPEESSIKEDDPSSGVRWLRSEL